MRLEARAAAFESVVTLYEEFGGISYTGVGYKGSTGCGHGVFELINRPVDFNLTGLFVGTAMSLRIEPSAIMNHKDRLKDVVTTVREHHPVSPLLGDYSLVAAVFLNIRDRFPCYCIADSDDGGDQGVAANHCTDCEFILCTCDGDEVQGVECASDEDEEQGEDRTNDDDEMEGEEATSDEDKVEGEKWSDEEDEVLS